MWTIDPNTAHAVHRFLDLLYGRFDTAQAILFGSRARGTYRPDSDADLAQIFHR